MVTPGQVAKAAGIAQVDEHTDAAWRVVFDAELLRLAQRGVDFTADDVVRAAGLPPASTSPNAVGARVNAAARRGLILPTGALAKGERKARHAGMQRVWRGTGTAKLHPEVPAAPIVQGLAAIGARPPDPKAPLCGRCKAPLTGIAPTIDSRFVEGRCKDHGLQVARV